MNTMDDTDEMIECPACHGAGFVADPHGDEDEIPCDDCMGDGAVERGAEIHGDAAEGDTPIGLADDDGEPVGIDDDAGYDPYTGGAEDDGYDTGCFDDGFCDSDF